jgi:hypothetical protein
MVATVEKPASNDLVVQSHKPLAVSRIGEMEEDFAKAVRQRELLKKYIQSQLDVDRHFYKVNESQKPSLTKEGAELICLPHGLVPDYQVLSGPLEPPTTSQRYQVTVKCVLRNRGDADSFFGSGIGSASSYITKKDGTEQARQRDIGLCHNSTMKMAQKSAYIAATLNATAASEFFTQDLEEWQDSEPHGDSEPQQPAQPCPVCNGNMWDNRQDNDARERRGEKRRPDFKCRDKSCNGVIWDARPTCTESQLDTLNNVMGAYGQALADKRGCDIRDGHGLALKKITDKIKAKYKYLRIGSEMNPTEIFSQLKQADADHVTDWIRQVLSRQVEETTPDQEPVQGVDGIPF